jgi:aspartyl-tRNA(Asn)/glutamyl-tRNA(Gln) amidotransferase subunit C
MTEAEVRWVSHLARLAISPQETILFAGQLTQIVAYMEQLQQVAVEGVEPLTNVAAAKNVFREDTSEPSLAAADVLANAPACRDQFFAVPAVLD